MVVLVKLFGIVLVACGVIFLISQNLIKRYIAFWTKGKRLYMGGCLSTLIGLVLLLAASQCRLAWFVTLFGIVALIKGILIFVLGPEKLISMINWWGARPPVVLRIYALFVSALGALLIYAT